MSAESLNMSEMSPPLAGFKSPPIAVVGNINIDIRTSVIPASPQMFRDGETSVGEIDETAGGGGANTAIAAGLLGGHVHFCARVGRDAAGAALRRHLERIGILSHLVEARSPTGRSIALTWDNHSRHFISSLPSCAELAEEDVDVEALARAGCRHLYRADIWFAPKMLDGGNLALLSRARAAGMETSIDLNWDPQWNGNEDRAVAKRIAAVMELLPHVSWAHGNERELCRFTGAADVQSAARLLLDRGAGGVIIHRGERGSAAITRAGEHVEAAAQRVAAIVNEIGTGDVFTAAFLLLADLPLVQRLNCCNEIAAQHVDGTLQLMPPLSD